MMTEKEKLLVFMAHAEDLQKIADESCKELQAATAAVKAMAKQLPAEASGAVATVAGKIVTSSLIGPMEKNVAEFNSVVETAKNSIKGLWIYPVVMSATFIFMLLIIGYFGVHWLKDERYELKAEISALNHELAQTANVSRINGKDGYWVEIDVARDILKTTDNKTFAKMPRQ